MLNSHTGSVKTRIKRRTSSFHLQTFVLDSESALRSHFCGRRFTSASGRSLFQCVCGHSHDNQRCHIHYTSTPTPLLTCVQACLSCSGRSLQFVTGSPDVSSDHSHVAPPIPPRPPGSILLAKQSCRLPAASLQWMM